MEFVGAWRVCHLGGADKSPLGAHLFEAAQQECRTPRAWLARKNGAELAIIDTPGKSDSIATEAARQANLVLIPIRPQVFDLETLDKVRDILLLAKNPLICPNTGSGSCLRSR